MTTEPIRFLNFHTIEELFEFLTPWSRDPRRVNVDLNDYVFRGHHSSEFQLIPTALRQSMHEQVWRSAGTGKEHMHAVNDPALQTLHIHMLMEYTIIRNFFKLADKQGLMLPVSAKLRENLINSVNIYGFLHHYPAEWLPNDLLEIAALAQHYGLPTRLLDWTYDCYVALFFGFQNIDDLDGGMSLWALNKEQLSWDKYRDTHSGIEFITPPYFGNPNLAAQKGLFTHVPFKLTPLKKINPPIPILRTPLEDTVSTIKESGKSPLLLKLTVSRKFAIQARKILSNLGYGQARIFPGYKGVAEELQEVHIINPMQNFRTRPPLPPKE